MKINNPLQMNDWEIKKFLKVILSIQLALWVLVGLDTMGLHIPILREFIGFIYLTFVPGILILRIIKLHKLGNIETVLYSVGLGLFTLMFMGFFMNMVYPLFGIPGPIALVPLVITLSSVVLVLCILSYIMDKDFSDTSYIDVEDILSPPALFLCLIPFLAIFGTYLVNFYHNNVLLMLLIVVIAIIALLIGFDKFIPMKLYPMVIFVIAISLLYHTSLISMYLWGYDVNTEYYYSNLVLTNSIWDPTIPSTVNAMLSIVMFAPIVSDICNMNPTWVFKIIYPFLFALVPLGLYHIFQKQTDDKIAFLSCLFFVSVFTFFTEMLALARQQIAELFLVLFIMVMINKNMGKINRSFLLIISGISLAVSHYGLSYIYMLTIIAAWLILVLGENIGIRKLIYTLFSRFNIKIGHFAENHNPLKEYRTINPNIVLLFITFTLAWYMYVSDSSAFNTIINIGDHITSSIFTDFLNRDAADGLDILLTKRESPLHNVLKYLHLASQLFIAIGVISFLLKPGETKFKREFGAISLVFCGICFAGIAVPHFASSLNTSRLYQIVLIALSPFCVIGCITFSRVFYTVIRMQWTGEHEKSLLKLISIFFAIFLLFNTGWIYEIAKDHPSSIALSQESIKEYGNSQEIGAFYGGYIPEQDVFSAKWIARNRVDNTKIFGDYRAFLGVLQSYGGVATKGFSKNLLSNGRINATQGVMIQDKSYYYLRYLNNIENLVSIKTYNETFKGYHHYNATEVILFVEERNKIYTNGGSEIFHNQGVE